MKNKLKIFVSAYACEPNLGSEIGVGWHWVLQMSKYFDLWVLTRKSNQTTIESWLKENKGYSNINFIYFDLPYYLRFWKKGMRGVRTYYNIWQWATNSIVKRTMQNNGISIFHHLTYGNALWSVSSYGQKQFFIWGPTGGVETISSEFSKHYNAKGRGIEWLRRTVVSTLKYNSGFNKRCENANLVLCKTEFLKDSISPKFGNKAILFTDVAVASRSFELINAKNSNETINYIIVGKLDPWRGFDLIIEAFALAKEVAPEIRLKIIGNGADWNRLQNLIKEKNLNKYIKMLGAISMDEYNQHMLLSDVVVNPSLKEGAVTTAFDAMALGKPLICTDTLGYTRYFSEDYAIIIPIQNRQMVINELKEGVLKLTDKELRDKMGVKSQKASEKFTWDARGAEIYEVISNAFNESVSR